MDTQSQKDLFSDKQEQWLLILGSDWAASNGIPLSHHRTRWSPSVSDLVRYELFRTQSHEVFERMESELGINRPPLGLIADTLEAQNEWLQQHIQGTKPSKTAFRLADLAKGGMFSHVFSSTPDDLFEQALDALHVPYLHYGLEHSLSPNADVLPILKEWDDRIFNDTKERLQRENRLIEMQLQQALQHTDSILIVGHHPHPTGVLSVLLKQLEEDTQRKIVWIFEEELLSLQQDIAARDDSPLAIFTQRAPNFTKHTTEALADWLQEIAEIRDIPQTPFKVIEQHNRDTSSILNKTYDLRPIFVYVPGLNIFSSYFKQALEVSLRTLLSVATLLILLSSGYHYYTYRSFSQKEKPLRDALTRLQSLIGPHTTSPNAKDTQQISKPNELKVFLHAQQQAFQLATNLRAFKRPKRSSLVVPMLTQHMHNRLDTIGKKVRHILQQKVALGLYRERLKVVLHGHPNMQSMGYYDKLMVSARDLSKPLAATRYARNKLPRRLQRYRTHKRYMLYYRSGSFLQNVMRKEMLATPQKRLAVSIHVPTRQEEIVELIKESFLDTIQSRSQYKDIITTRMVRQLLKKGKISVYIPTFDAAESLTNAVGKLREFISSFPDAPLRLGVSRKASKQALLPKLKSFTYLAIEPYTYETSRDYLRQNTSYKYSQSVHDNTYLRWNWTDPLIRTLLIDTYHKVGEAPRSLGLLYQRLLQTMLSRGKWSQVLKFRMLERLAYEKSQMERPLREDKAIMSIAKALAGTSQPMHYIKQATSILKECAQNGVLLFHPKDGLRLTDKRFDYVFLSRALSNKPLKEKKHLLLRMPKEMTAFYAGLSPSVERLVKSWLDDYNSIETLYREKNVDLLFANPYFYNISRSVVAVSNGIHSHTLTKRVESILIKQINNWNTYVQYHSVLNAMELPTPRIQEWLIASLDKNAPYDYRIPGVMRNVTNLSFIVSVKRWLNRICTPKDRRFQHRWRYGHQKFPVGQRRLQINNKWAITQALGALVKMNTPDSIRFVKRWAQREHDKRFHPVDWRYIRSQAMLSLAHIGLYGPLKSLYPTLKKHPEQWCYYGDRGNTSQRYYCVINKLGQVNDKDTAKLLVSLMMKKEPLTPSVLRYKSEAVTALARIDDEIVFPLIDPILKQPLPKEGPDLRVFAAMLCSYKNNKKRFPWVKKIVRAHLTYFPTLKHKQATQILTRMDMNALIGFRSKRAFEVFKELISHKKWLKRAAPNTLTGLAFFRIPEKTAFMRRLLYCEVLPVSYRKQLYKVMYLNKKEIGYHEMLSRSLQMLEEGVDKVQLKTLCGKQTPVTLSAKERLIMMTSGIAALARFQQSTDIARLSVYTRSPNKYIKQAAIKALGTFQTQQASDALARIYTSNPKLKYAYLRALHQQRMPYNAKKFVAMLKKERNFYYRMYLFYYLQKAGNEDALITVFPYQYAKRKRLNQGARYAFYKVAMQLKGHLTQLEALKKQIKAMPKMPDSARKVFFNWRTKALDKASAKREARRKAALRRRTPHRKAALRRRAASKPSTSKTSKP